MDRSDEQLVSQLKESLAGGMYQTAFAEDEAGDVAEVEDDNPLGTDFFKAINAYRAARTSGDADAVAKAERHLQDVVRGELLGERCN